MTQILRMSMIMKRMRTKRKKNCKHKLKESTAVTTLVCKLLLVSDRLVHILKLFSAISFNYHVQEPTHSEHEPKRKQHLAFIAFKDSSKLYTTVPLILL